MEVNIDENLFGNVLIVGIGIILMVVIWKLKSGKLSEVCFKEKNYLSLLFAILGYIIFIAKSAPMNEIRYLSPVFAVAVAVFFVVLYRCIRFLFKRRKRSYSIFCIFICIVLINGWYHYDWEYLYKETKDRVEYAIKEGRQSQGICIYNHGWAVLHSYREISQVKNIIFL